MTDDVEGIAGRLTEAQRRALAKVCGIAPSRRSCEWVRIDDDTYAKLRRRKLIGGVTTIQPDRLDEGSPWRLCYAHPLGRAVRAHILKEEL